MADFRQPWTDADYRALHRYAKRGDSLAQMAGMMGRTKDDCDQALWQMMGRPWLRFPAPKIVEKA